jgi:cytochrome c553
MKLRRFNQYIVVVGCMFAVAACGTSSNAERGKQLFNGETQFANGSLPACNSCHADIVEGESPLGPNLSNIGNRAATTLEGQSAEAYLRASLLEPDAYLAPGYQEGIMYREYPEVLSQQDVNDLLAYMLTLQSGQD